MPRAGLASTTVVLALGVGMGGPARACIDQPTVYFDSRSADLTPRGRMVVEETARRFVRLSDPVVWERLKAAVPWNSCTPPSDSSAPSRLELVGHADDEGLTAEQQRVLSLRSAAAVASVVEANGVSPERITVVGAGSSERLVPAPASDPYNRRVDLLRR